MMDAEFSPGPDEKSEEVNQVAEKKIAPKAAVKKTSAKKSTKAASRVTKKRNLSKKM